MTVGRRHRISRCPSIAFSNQFISHQYSMLQWQPLSLWPMLCSQILSLWVSLHKLHFSVHSCKKTMVNINASSVISKPITSQYATSLNHIYTVVDCLPWRSCYWYHFRYHSVSKGISIVVSAKWQHCSFLLVTHIKNTNLLTPAYMYKLKIMGF